MSAICLLAQASKSASAPIFIRMGAIRSGAFKSYLTQRKPTPVPAKEGG